MALVEIDGIEGAKALIGETIGPSDWREVTQEDIDLLRAALRRRSVDPRRRRAGEDREPLRRDDRARQPDALDDRRLPAAADQRRPACKLGVNYGWNKVRFPAPVPAGSRVRASAEIVSIDELDDGWFQQVTRFTRRGRGQREALLRRRPVGRASSDGSRQPVYSTVERALHAALAVAGDVAVEGVVARLELALDAVVVRLGDRLGLRDARSPPSSSTRRCAGSWTGCRTRSCSGPAVPVSSVSVKANVAARVGLDRDRSAAAGASDRWSSRSSTRRQWSTPRRRRRRRTRRTQRGPGLRGRSAASSSSGASSAGHRCLDRLYSRHRTRKSRDRSARGRSATLEDRRLAGEEAGDAVLQILGAHALGDPVPLELQVVGERVVEALPGEAT